MVLSTVIASSLREIGEVRVPLIISVTATCVNTFLNWVLIYGNLGAPRLEVTGAAYATMIARGVEAVLYIAYITKKKQPFSITPADLLHIDWRLFAGIMKKGGMIMCSELLWVLSETVMTALYNGRGGADVVSGMSASFSIANLYFVSFTGITTATGIIIGRSLGADKLDEARKEARWLLNGSIVFGGIVLLLGLLTIPLVPVVFSSLSGSAQAICRSMVFWMAICMPAWVYQNAQFAVSRAGGDTMMGLVLDGGCTLFIAIPLTFILAWYTAVGPVLLYMLVKLVDPLRIVIAWFWLKRERWVRNLTHQTSDQS